MLYVYLQIRNKTFSCKDQRVCWCCSGKSWPSCSCKDQRALVINHCWWNKCHLRNLGPLFLLMKTVTNIILSSVSKLSTWLIEWSFPLGFMVIFFLLLCITMSSLLRFLTTLGTSAIYRRRGPSLLRVSRQCLPWIRSCNKEGTRPSSRLEQQGWPRRITVARWVSCSSTTRRRTLPWSPVTAAHRWSSRWSRRRRSPSWRSSTPPSGGRSTGVWTQSLGRYI